MIVKNNIAIRIAGKVSRYIDTSMNRATPTQRREQNGDGESAVATPKEDLMETTGPMDVASMLSGSGRRTCGLPPAAAADCHPPPSASRLRYRVERRSGGTATPAAARSGRA